MADTDGAEESHDPEAPQEEVDDEHQALLHLSKYGDSRRAQPWQQWTFKEKANYVMDRIFLGFLFLFFMVLMAECCYKIWYVTNMKKIAEFVSDLVVFLFNWLLTQEKHEELAEL